MKRKYPTIDLLKLMESWNGMLWTDFLMKCRNHNDLEKLKKTLYGIQSGMDLLVKQSLADSKICEIFATMTKSIEVTAKKIIRKKYPCVLDQGFSSSEIDHEGVMRKEFKHKQLREIEFQSFLKGARF